MIGSNSQRLTRLWGINGGLVDLMTRGPTLPESMPMTTSSLFALAPGHIGPQPRSGRLRGRLYAAVAALALAEVAPANDKCHESSGVYTCQGDQSAGVQNGHNDLGTNADDVIVEDLSGNIGPNLGSGRTAGLMFTYDTGDDLTALNLQYLEDAHRIVIDASGFAGIRFGGPVKDGDSGDHHDDSSGGNGDAGRNGRNLTLTLGSGADIVGQAAQQRGVDATSVAGDGGHGGGSDCCSGGHGGVGGNAGGVSIHGAGSIDMPQFQSQAIYINTVGGAGGYGQDAGADGHGGDGAAGGNSGLVILDSATGGTWALAGSGGSDTQTGGVQVVNISGAGADGGKGTTHGGDGGPGGSASPIKINSNHTGAWQVTTSGDNAPGMILAAVGGDGGHGGHGDDDHGGKGGQGGQGGDVQFGQIDASITTAGAISTGLFVYSKAGKGGNGANSEFSDPGDGGSGGGGGAVTLNGTWTLTTAGSQSAGIALYSLGADGGSGGDGDFTSGGAGGNTGPSGDIGASIGGLISTAGGAAPGLIAQSVAGHAGSGGESSGIIAFGASGGSAGAGGNVTLSSGAAITTAGDQSTAITAQSIGGGGGSGGDGFSAYYSDGGGGGLGGAGGSVSVSNQGNLNLAGNDAHGIFVQSIGGAGGSGGNAGGILSLGGGGKAGADGGAVEVTNSGTIQTGKSGGSVPPTGPDSLCGTGCSFGILAQSIGGGGGHGGTAVGAFSVGAAGGKGGNGARVTVATTGSISTGMRQSSGIHAQSIGGGGGHGGGGGAIDGVLSVAVGGAGGNGGAGGDVTVTPTRGALITSTGEDSHGVHAHSIGGGGGTAGFAVSAAAGVDVPALDLAVGASGGNGGDSGAVTIDTVDNSYTGSTPTTVNTKGKRSNGLFAQSVGGGGGNAGLTVAFSASTDASVSVGVGGSGGSGGDAGTATLTSDADISVVGEQANALLAQSVGGGGGNGGTTVSGDLALGGDGATVALGGGGGNAGAGGAVSLTHTGTGMLIANGDQGDALLAQSLGGGGGNGGLTIAGNLSTSDSTTLGVAMGSGAGSGGDGSSVSVSVDSPTGVQATGNRGVGIRAQSIGGGGGKGGMTLNGSIATSTDGTRYAVTLGSNGGTGGAGGNVDVSNSGPVSAGDATEPAFTQAHGIFAQSIGGGGGSGALTGDLDISGDSQSVDHSLDLEMSGSGNGGTGGGVGLSNSGAVSTQNRNSHALFAQSIGGGGGDADAALLTLIDKTTNDPTPSISTSYVASGSLGSGSTGGTVTLTNSGSLSTTAPWSHGIFAQSVGGGGGSNAPLGSPFIPCDQCGTLSAVWDATVALGGQTGNGGNGGNIAVTSSGAIHTGGAGSDGIFAQSIGAGGGSAGAASGLAQGGDYIGFNQFTALDLALGSAGVGGNPASGHGGTVSVNHGAGDIITEDIGSVAIYVQSVGAGGGRGGTGAIGSGGRVDVGGNGAAAGDGGDVEVKVSGGTIQAGRGSGGAGIVSAAYGIFAQSIGGGGGHGGNVLMGATDNFTSAAGLTSSKGHDSSGEGGTVTVQLATALTTWGDSSVGILAQSVGGGGGIQGEVAQSPSGAKAGSNGGSGKAGAVSVSVSGAGSVTTSGPNAHAIWAQTAGGSGASTTTDAMVEVEVAGTLRASGANAMGIYAQSTGDGRGPIAVTVDDGGSVQASGAVVYLKDAPASTLDNAGTIASLGGTAGVAIQTENTSLTVTNTGTISGQIIKASSINLVNQAPGTVVSGPRLEADQFINHGTLDIGDTGTIAETILTGDLTGTAGSRIIVDLDPDRPGKGGSDVLNVEGTATLSGTLDVRLAGDGLAVDPNRWTFLQAGRLVGDASAALSVQGGTAVIALDLKQRGQHLHLDYAADFANDRVRGAASHDQAAVADHLQRAFVAGGGRLGELLSDLAGVPALGDYLSSLDAFRPEVYASNQITTLFAARDFADGLTGCRERGEGERVIAEERCAWASVDAGRLTQGHSRDDFGFDEDRLRLTGGAEVGFGGGWTLGGGLGVDDSDLTLKRGHGSSVGTRLHAGVALQRVVGSTRLAATLSGGNGDFKVRRSTPYTPPVEATQRLWSLSGQFRAAHTLSLDDWTLTAGGDIGFDHLSGDDFNEQGDGIRTLRIDGHEQTWWSIQPGIRLAGDLETREGHQVRPEVSVGLTQFLKDPGATTTASLAGSPSTAGTFDADSGMDRTYLDIGLRLAMQARQGWSLSLAGFGRIGGDINGYGGSLNLELPF